MDGSDDQALRYKTHPASSPESRIDKIEAIHNEADAQYLVGLANRWLEITRMVADLIVSDPHVVNEPQRHGGSSTAGFQPHNQ